MLWKTVDNCIRKVLWGHLAQLHCQGHDKRKKKQRNFIFYVWGRRNMIKIYCMGNKVFQRNKCKNNANIQIYLLWRPTHHLWCRPQLFSSSETEEQNHWMAMHGSASPAASCGLPLTPQGTAHSPQDMAECCRLDGEER